MKRILFLMILMIGFCNVTKADTIDYCHVHYNHELRWDLGIYKGDYKITIDKATLHENDSIQIYYYTDTPCNTCNSALLLQYENSHHLISKKNNYYSIAVKDLFKWGGNNIKEIPIFYQANANSKNALQVFILVIK
jgi:hypothetical protein